MKVKDIQSLSDIRMITSNSSLENNISGIFACDLLSHVMGHAEENNVLITVLNNINVLGVASLLDLSCVIFTYDTAVSDSIISKADELKIPLFVTNKSTAEIVIMLNKIGV